MTLSELLKICRFNYIGLYIKGDFHGNYDRKSWQTWTDENAYMQDEIAYLSEGVMVFTQREQEPKLDIHLMPRLDADVIKTLEGLRDEIYLDSPVAVTALNYAIEKVRKY